MMQHFGKAKGEDIYLYTICKDDISVQIINYGAAVHSISLPDKSGAACDITGGYNSIDGYIHGNFKHGAMVGRCANRIANGTINIEGRQYQLSLNAGEHHVHGGFEGYHHRVWQVTDHSKNSIRLMLEDADGTEGYPGNATVYVTYTLDSGTLRLDMQATCDKTTVFNITNHAFFNLNGTDSNSIDDTQFEIYCNRYAETDHSNIPTGRILSSTGTEYDFARGKRLSDAKYDLCYCYDDCKMRHMARAHSPQSGITMDVYSDMPAMQFYTVRGKECTMPDKNGAMRENCSWFCMEPQYVPDTPNHSNFVSNTVQAGEAFAHTIMYKFKRE